MKNYLLLIAFWGLVNVISANNINDKIVAENKKANVVQNNIGVTICGGEFGQLNMPGVYNRDYIYPDENQMKYYASKGILLIQIPFRWERLQRSLFGPLHVRDLQLIDQSIYAAAKYNIAVILDMHNYGRYRMNNEDHIIGSQKVPRAAYKDAWRKIADYFKKHNNIYAYNIMAEPNNMGDNSWFLSAQVAIIGIREVDKQNAIMVDGDGYACAEKWVEYSDDLKNLIDPNNNLIYSAHNYFDDDCSGSYQYGYDAVAHHPNIGVDKAKPFVNWLKKNNKRGFFGEFGVPCTNGYWLEALDRFVQYLKKENIGGSYWAGGAWWKDYSLAIEPRNGKDRPQMLVLLKYNNNNNALYASKN